MSGTYTSRVAYREAVLDGRTETARQRILDCLRTSAVPLTRRQISELTRIPINAVPAACLSLLGAGLIQVAFEDEDQVTHAKAQFLEPVRPGPVQRTFHWVEVAR